MPLVVAPSTFGRDARVAGPDLRAGAAADVRIRPEPRPARAGAPPRVRSEPWDFPLVRARDRAAGGTGSRLHPRGSSGEPGPDFAVSRAPWVELNTGKSPRSGDHPVHAPFRHGGGNPGLADRLVIRSILAPFGPRHARRVHGSRGIQSGGWISRAGATPSSCMHDSKENQMKKLGVLLAVAGDVCRWRVASRWRRRRSARCSPTSSGTARPRAPSAPRPARPARSRSSASSPRATPASRRRPRTAASRPSASVDHHTKNFIGLGDYCTIVRGN